MAEQISVSRDTLRAELSDMELRLVDRIAKFQADKADKKDLAELASRVTAIEKWKYAWPSAAVLAAVAPILIFFYHH